MTSPSSLTNPSTLNPSPVVVNLPKRRPEVAHESVGLRICPPKQPQSASTAIAGKGGIYTYADLRASKLQPITFVLEGLIAEGQTCFLAGPYAIGKTMLGLQLAQHLAIGRPFMGRAISRPYKTAFIDAENGLQEITTRVRDQAEAFMPALTEAESRLLGTSLVYVDTSDESDLQFLRLDSNGFSTLQGFVNKYGIEALIVDNFGRLFLGKETDDRDLKDFFRGLTCLKKACPQLRLILFLHHVTKPQFDTPPDLLTDPYMWLSRVRGSGRILDFSEVRLGFDSQKTDSGERYYVLNGIVRSAQASPLLLERAANGKAFQLHTDKATVIDRLFQRSDRQKELYNSLPQGRDFSFTECCQLLRKDGKPFCKQTVTDTLAVCVSNSLLKKNPDGSYRCT